MTLQLCIKTTHNDLYESHSAAYKGDSGIDLYFPRDITIKAKSTDIIDLEISCEMKEMNVVFTGVGQNFFVNKSYYIYPRSSISKTPLRMANSVGIIDSGYRHTLKVAVDNTSETDYAIKRGDRLFQICSADLKEISVYLTDTLSSSDRGSGFGSSGTCNPTI